MTEAAITLEANCGALRWYGGKLRLAPWIIAHFPPHRVYVEPYGGGAGVLLRKPRIGPEVYNDLDGEVVTLFRVLQDPTTAQQLARLIELTPYARAEFELSYLPTDDPVERARRLLVRSYMGFGSNAHATSPSGSTMTGWRASTCHRSSTMAGDWRNYPDRIPRLVDRLRGVYIDNRDAIDVMQRHDRPDTLHYVDPPYLWETRSRGNRYDLVRRMYRHELDRGGHADLLTVLRGLVGMVVLSGYPDPLYDDMLPDWRRVERQALADGARPRTEVLWISPSAAAAIDAASVEARRRPVDLFAAQVS